MRVLSFINIYIFHFVKLCPEDVLIVTNIGSINNTEEYASI